MREFGESQRSEFKHEEGQQFQQPPSGFQPIQCPEGQFPQCFDNQCTCVSSPTPQIPEGQFSSPHEGFPVPSPGEFPTQPPTTETSPTTTETAPTTTTESSPTTSEPSPSPTSTESSGSSGSGSGFTGSVIAIDNKFIDYWFK